MDFCIVLNRAPKGFFKNYLSDNTEKTVQILDTSVHILDTPSIVFFKGISVGENSISFFKKTPVKILNDPESFFNTLFRL